MKKIKKTLELFLLSALLFSCKDSAYISLGIDYYRKNSDDGYIPLYVFGLEAKRLQEENVLVNVYFGHYTKFREIIFDYSEELTNEIKNREMSIFRTFEFVNDNGEKYREITKLNTPEDLADDKDEYIFGREFRYNRKESCYTFSYYYEDTFNINILKENNGKFWYDFSFFDENDNIVYVWDIEGQSGYYFVRDGFCTLYFKCSNNQIELYYRDY